MTDPSGFFFSGLLKSLWGGLKSMFSMLGRTLQTVLKNPLVRSIIQVLGCGAMAAGSGGFGGAAGCAALTGALTLGAGGSLTAALKSAAFAFASAAVFTGVGEMLGSNPNLFVKAAVHGVAGGALSVAEGGNFLQGFAANAVGAFAGGASDGAFGPGGASPDIIAHTLIVAAAGCASASLTGGKCADAAVTAAFANIYNFWGDPNNLTRAKAMEAGEAVASGASSSAWWLRLLYGGGVAAVGTVLFIPDSQIRSWFSCSFAGDTRVVTRDGRRPIRSLRAGSDWVLARNEHTGETAWKPVVAHYSNRYQETVRLRVRDVESGAEHTIVSNRVHPFWIADGTVEMRLVANGGVIAVPGTNDTGRWVEAHRLEPGDQLLDADGTYSVVVARDIAPEPLQAYNITVGDFHTFFVAGADNNNAPAVWVHNNCPPNLNVDWGGGAKLSNLAEGDMIRIQNAADKYDSPISVVGSRAAGTAKWDSDWDYFGGMDKKVLQSLPRANPELFRDLYRAPSELFPGPVNANQPYITFYPRQWK